VAALFFSKNADKIMALPTKQIKNIAIGSKLCNDKIFMIALNNVLPAYIQKPRRAAATPAMCLLAARAPALAFGETIPTANEYKAIGIRIEVIDKGYKIALNSSNVIAAIKIEPAINKE
jgi:hypothetical protein